MVSVRSVRVFKSTEPGSPAWIWGKSSLMESTTWMTLAPGWRWTLIRMAGSLLAQLDSLSFSAPGRTRSEEHTSELQSQFHLVCRLLLEKKNLDHASLFGRWCR